MDLFARRGSWSLKTKLALSSGVLMFAFSVASTSWVLHNVEKDVRAGVIHDQASLVRVAAGDLGEKVALRRDAIETIARLLSEASPATNEAMIEFFAPRPVLRKMFDDVMVADVSGRIVYFDAPDVPHDEDAVGDRPYFRQILAGAPFVVSSPMRSAKTGNLSIAFAAPLRSPDGAVTGALIASLSLTRPNVISALGDRSLGESGYFALIAVGDDGVPVIVMHRHADRIMSPTSGEHRARSIERALGGEEVNETSRNLQGVETLQSFIRVKGVPWVLVAAYPTSEAFGELEKRRFEALWIGATLFVVTWLLAWSMSNWMLRPLGRLTEVMEQHASDPMLPITATEMGSSELDALVNAYNAQAASRHAAQSRLEASERHMKDITNNLPVLICYIDKDECCAFVNDTSANWFGVEPVAVIGRNVRQIVGAERYDSLEPAMRRCLAGERLSFELEVDTLQGRRILENVYVPDRGPSGDVVGFYALSSDVTPLKQVQSELDGLARRDVLTGLANRYHFEQVLPLALERCARAGSAIAILFLDVDHFKAINDTYGHAAGDETLREVARRLRGCVRTTDTVARLGGDEFVVILEAPQSPMLVELIAGKIVEAIAEPFQIEGRLLALTTSVGIAFSANANVGRLEALAVADGALYRAKTAGRGRYCLDRIMPSTPGVAAAE